MSLRLSSAAMFVAAGVALFGCGSSAPDEVNAQRRFEQRVQACQSGDAEVHDAVLGSERGIEHWNVYSAPKGSCTTGVDATGAPLVVIQGGDEKAKGEVQIKDLRLGAELAAGIESREEYASQRLAQFSVPEIEMVAAVRKALGA